MHFCRKQVWFTIYLLEKCSKSDIKPRSQHNYHGYHQKIVFISILKWLTRLLKRNSFTKPSIVKDIAFSTQNKKSIKPSTHTDKSLVHTYSRSHCVSLALRTHNNKVGIDLPITRVPGSQLRASHRRWYSIELPRMVPLWKPSTGAGGTDRVLYSTISNSRQMGSDLVYTS